ncbi:MAG: DUF192 domain-containing protein [Rhodospirillales bacterium]|nr:DUF192 domain-containing protein [Rhodospirillales bacterium]MDE0378055.1 DUF192 domain-containing protein [Rhodospirillales bacterium]
MPVRLEQMRALALVALLAVVAFAPAAAAESGALEPLTIETGAGVHAIEVEVARTAAERGVGLMHRAELAPEHGMLFDFGATRQVTMWMKNTLIPLDMFFADEDGRIVTIAERTTPLSEKRIHSGQPVLFVLEMIGGSAERLGIAVGDRLRHVLIGRQ